MIMTDNHDVGSDDEDVNDYNDSSDDDDNSDHNYEWRKYSHVYMLFTFIEINNGTEASHDILIDSLME